MRIFFCLLLLIAAPVFAQTNSNQPLEITADNTLEWRRNDKKFVATGNVAATQGNATIRAQTLTADYGETKSSSFDIHKLTADGNVRIESQASTATGDKAVYDVPAGVAVMTGGDLRLTSPDQTVTAKDSFEYRVNEGTLFARGNVIALRGKDKIAADTMSAAFNDDKKTGKRTLRRLEATGNVIITTPTEVLSGARGVYDAVTNIATITGNVKITRGPNVLEGDKAEVNLTTNVSTMQGSPAAGGRVRGVFYPDSAKQSETAPAPQAPGGFQPLMTAP